MKIKYPLSQNTFDEKEINSIKHVINTGNFTMGKYCKKFESHIQKYLSAKQAIFVNSGSSANLLALSAIKEISAKSINKRKYTNNSEVIVSKLTWPTTVWPIIQNNFKPIFVDCNLNDLQMNIEETIKKINKNTFAIFVTHVMGGSVDLEPLIKIAKKKGLWIIEDTCESFGAKYKNKFLGTIGDVGTFSTFFSHHISTIEGGIITTNNKSLANQIYSMRSHGWVRDRSDKNTLIKKYNHIDNKFLFVTSGYNLRPTEINGAIGIEQLKKSNKFKIQRKKIFKYLIEIFNPYKDRIQHWLEFEQFVDPSPFSFCVIFKNKSDLNAIKKQFNLDGIEFRPIISGNILRQPAFSKYKNQDKKNSNANKVMDLGIYIGINPFTKLSNLNVIKVALKKTFI